MGVKPIHVMSPAERTKLPEVTDFFIDLGMSKEEVEKYVSVGDSVTRERDLVEMGGLRERQISGQPRRMLRAD